MTNPRRRKLRRRLAYLPTFFSISIVLFLCGLFGLFTLNARSLKEKLRENIEFSIYFRDEVTDTEVKKMAERLRTEPYVLSAEFIDKKDATKRFIDSYGEDPHIEMLNVIPWPHSIDLKFKEGFVNPDSLVQLKNRLEQNPIVREVEYSHALVSNLDRYVRVLAIILLSVAAILTLVSIALIHNTIRLTLFAKRFIIKSMQLVGATPWFIRKPFITKGIILGICSSLLACLMLIGTLWYLKRKYAGLDIIALDNYAQIGVLFFGLSLLGILMSALSSYFAVNRYLKMKLDDLF